MSAQKCRLSHAVALCNKTRGWKLEHIRLTHPGQQGPRWVKGPNPDGPFLCELALSANCYWCEDKLPCLTWPEARPRMTPETLLNNSPHCLWCVHTLIKTHTPIVWHSIEIWKCWNRNRLTNKSQIHTLIPINTWAGHTHTHVQWHNGQK